YVRALAFTPVERLQGPAQKIFYLHVPAALWTEAAMVLVGLAGIFYLFLKDPRLDRFAEASAEVGTVFATIVLTTGPIWGKPIWGTWWTWDARLTSTLFLFFLYVGYLLVRRAGARRPAMSEVPQNAGYMMAAYIVTAVILIAYAVSLYRRTSKP